MLPYIINFSIKNKFIILLFTIFIIGFGGYSLSQISIGAVPDVTNNQVQVITTSHNLSAQDMEQFITYPIELEMANLPGVTNIRSISKFGLSVVTIVFEDDMGTYLPRQLIAEKIKSATEKIPKDFGIPKMGPITTGLGEIYQYTLDVKPEFKDKYTAEDLRTIQDWIVKRQLSGIPGVVEINTWGGLLKQYEVAINTEKLYAMDITSKDVFKALETNNSITGSGYIEKNDQAYFIRGEGLVANIEDINNIVVKNRDGILIYIKDVANVGYGSATRFGAITGNGEGEKVLGQVMMLKGANSKQVIEAVKERVASISNSLPEGVYINPFLERSKLISKTMLTVTENLTLGCLIVIFVVVLLLSNIRSGLIVASVIPLCLLFALSLMYIFGVEANLMSLGAIDFGIIIDGAVIIVEFTMSQIMQKKNEINLLAKEERQNLKDSIVFTGVLKMMRSAIFGQFIILVVFIPILSLSGIEGKLFKPMALTFSFALIGAMILCITYVPVMASLFLKPPDKIEKNTSLKLMYWLNKMYDPIIHWALQSKKLILSIAVLLLVGAMYLYTIIGGEFLPTLDEGDFVIQPVLKTGTSLSKTIEITTQIEQILLDSFPEVEQVVTRIGAAEVPTDPMSMEESDVIIILKPKSEWVSAESKDELANKFKAALAIMPGMEVEFTQPIEMRFNELITGVRTDIAIKIFGEDLNILSKKGNEIKSVIENIDGAADITVEKVVGLPQINVNYDRAKIARYGLNIQDLNEMVAMSFVGRTVGSVFEGGKRFDIVVRLDKENGQGFVNLKNLYIDLPSGGKIRLGELANISHKKGVAKISRENTHRRIVVGINVRNRDLQSVVNEVRQAINENVKLPVGYSITYGGQFENLQKAKSRLNVAVPIALIFIFTLLYLAFKSVKEALIIYSAIPLAAVGGVLFLWIRGLPFSISAGIGFITLFGIAVLNGIVLIEHFKGLLQNKDFDDVEAVIKQGSKDRLRAVLVTALAAILGFLPMAISTNVGAEVQRPLATVVIGGLITSTLLTLLVLPVLYAYFSRAYKGKSKMHFIKKPSIIIILILSLSAAKINAQEKTLEDIIALTTENNTALKASMLRVRQADVNIGSAFRFDKTDVYYSYDENNLAVIGGPLRVFGIQQEFQFPTIYFAEKKVLKAYYNIENNALKIKKREIESQVVAAYYSYQIEKEKEYIYKHLDSLYKHFAYAAQRRYELGATNYLERVTAISKQKQINIQYEQAKINVTIARRDIEKIVQTNDSLIIADKKVEKIPLKTYDSNINNNIALEYYRNSERFFEAKSTLAKQQLLPDISLGYFQGSNSQINNLGGYQLGIRIPLLFSGQSTLIKASKIAKEIAVAEVNNRKRQLDTRYKQLNAQLQKYKKALDYYENEGTLLSDEILKITESSFKNGEIDFFQYIKSIENAYEIKINYLESLNLYNQNIININYLIF